MRGLPAAARAPPPALGPARAPVFFSLAWTVQTGKASQPWSEPTASSLLVVPVGARLEPSGSCVLVVTAPPPAPRPVIDWAPRPPSSPRRCQAKDPIPTVLFLCPRHSLISSPSRKRKLAFIPKPFTAPIQRWANLLHRLAHVLRRGIHPSLLIASLLRARQALGLLLVL